MSSPTWYWFGPTLWDTGDQFLDSTVLGGAFQWTANGGVDVGTEPVPGPK